MPDNVVDIIKMQNELRDHGHLFTLWPKDGQRTRTFTSGNFPG